MSLTNKRGLYKKEDDWLDYCRGVVVCCRRREVVIYMVQQMHDSDVSSCEVNPDHACQYVWSITSLQVWNLAGIPQKKLILSAVQEEERESRLLTYCPGQCVSLQVWLLANKVAAKQIGEEKATATQWNPTHWCGLKTLHRRCELAHSHNLLWHFHWRMVSRSKADLQLIKTGPRTEQGGH